LKSRQGLRWRRSGKVYLDDGRSTVRVPHGDHELRPPRADGRPATAPSLVGADLVTNAAPLGVIDKVAPWSQSRDVSRAMPPTVEKPTRRPGLVASVTAGPSGLSTRVVPHTTHGGAALLRCPTQPVSELTTRARTTNTRQSPAVTGLNRPGRRQPPARCPLMKGPPVTPCVMHRIVPQSSSTMHQNPTHSIRHVRLCFVDRPPSQLPNGQRSTRSPSLKPRARPAARSLTGRGSASGTIGELGPTVVTLDQVIRCSQLTRAGVRGYRSGVCGRPLGKRASRAFIPATVVWPERGQLLAPS